MRGSLVSAAIAALAGAALGSVAVGATGALACYQMVPNQAMANCNDAPTSGARDRFGTLNLSNPIGGPSAPPHADPVGESPTASMPTGKIFVDSAQQCSPGAWWILHTPNNDIVMACPRR